MTKSLDNGATWLNIGAKYADVGTTPGDVVTTWSDIGAMSVYPVTTWSDVGTMSGDIVTPEGDTERRGRTWGQKPGTLTARGLPVSGGAVRYGGASARWFSVPIEAST